MMKHTEAQLELAIIEPLGTEGYPHVLGEAIERQPQEILTKLRETILPKIVSGELRPSEAKELSEEDQV